MQISYLNRMSFMQMQSLLFEDLECKRGNTYLLDKILHDHLVFSDRALKMAKPRFVFLIRKPEETISSIIRMGDMTGIGWYKGPQKAADYYCSRLSSLGNFSRKIAEDYFFIESENLIDQTDQVLEGLARLRL